VDLTNDNLEDNNIPTPSEPSIKAIRVEILNLLESNFRLLNRQVISCELLQQEIDKAISAGRKPDKSVIFLLNSLQTKISDTMAVLLPLFKVEQYKKNILLEYNENESSGNVYEDFFKRLNPKTVRYLLNHPEKMGELQISEEDLKNYFRVKLDTIDEEFGENGKTEEI